MPNGESVSKRKIIIPERKPSKSKRKRSRKKRKKSKMVHIPPSVPEVRVSIDVPDYRENTDEIQTEEISILQQIAPLCETDAIPKELTLNPDEYDATEKYVPTLDEECTEVVSPEFYQETDPHGEEVTEPLDITEPIHTAVHIRAQHQNELRHLFLFGCCLFFIGLLPYSSSAFATLRPWSHGDPIPLLSLIYSNQQVVEDAQGNLALAALSPDDPLLSTEEEVDLPVMEDIPIIVEGPIVTEEVQPTITATLPAPQPRSPARPTPIIIPPHSMDHYFQKLWEVENEQDSIARALVWGDSTIAADGIIKDVRRNMQDRFGNAGAGFLPIALNSTWTIRKEILRKSSGWNTENYVYGKIPTKRYGLAGMVSTTTSVATAKLAGPKSSEGRIPSKRYQVFYQAQPKGGTFTVDIGEGPIEIETRSDEREERTFDLYAPNGSDEIQLKTDGKGTITIYGVALESQNYGVTWETLGVAGASISSMRKQDEGHMHEQVAHRDPALIVYWTGGNELGYPSLKSKTGAGYKKVYRNAVHKIRNGHPDSSCLLIGPLDQGKRIEGVIQSKPSLSKLIRFQKEVALELGCAYWDAQDAMGGHNSFQRWMSHTPKLASSDMSHLTGRGRRIIGETLSEVIEHSYDTWLLHNPNGLGSEE